MKLNDIWHFPRAELAAAYLGLLSTGLVVSTTIFAPRRTGKTSFLREDLAPAARAAGFNVAYIDLWQTRLSPGAAITRGLEEALEPQTLQQRAMSALQTPLKRIKAKASVGEVNAELEVDLADKKKQATELALHIDDLIKELVKRSPLLMLVDEAQELARNKDNELLSTALRTAITKHRDRIRVVFTGSSRTRLAHVFSNSDAPLYSVGAAIQNFPLLDQGFVVFVAQKFESATQRQMDLDLAWHEFQQFRQQPEPFLSAVVATMMDPALSLQMACQREHAELDHAENHEGTWAQLDTLQKQLLILLADNPAAKPFSKATLARLAKSMGIASLDAPSVQFALRRLSEKTIAAKSARGTYVFENDAFERWVRTGGFDSA